VDADQEGQQAAGTVRAVRHGRGAVRAERRRGGDVAGVLGRHALRRRAVAQPVDQQVGAGRGGREKAEGQRKDGKSGAMPRP
jgi:hypothetical protein